MTKATLLISLLYMSIFNLFGPNKKTENEFKFKELENKAVFTCNHILKGEPILYVSHDMEGDWQFLCGQDNHSEENAKVVSLKEIVELDNSVNDLYEMPKGVGAERDSVGKKWIPFRSE